MTLYKHLEIKFKKVKNHGSQSRHFHPHSRDDRHSDDSSTQQCAKFKIIQNNILTKYLKKLTG